MKEETYTPKEGDIVIGKSDLLIIGKYDRHNGSSHSIIMNPNKSYCVDKVYPYSIDKLHELMKEHLGYLGYSDANAKSIDIEPKQDNTFKTLDGVTIRIGIDKCYCISKIHKIFAKESGSPEIHDTFSGNNYDYVYFSNKQKADVYLHWLKGGKVQYKPKGSIKYIKPTFDINDYKGSEWGNDFEWRIEEAKTFITMDGYGVTFQDNGWSKDSLEAIDENKNHSIGYLSCTNPDFVYFKDRDKANIFLQALNGKTIQYKAFDDTWYNLYDNEFEVLTSLNWTLEYRIKPNTETTRDGVEVEVNENNKTIDRLWFVYNDDGNIEHDYVVMGSLDALNTFHSKAKAELFAAGVKGKQLQVLEHNNQPVYEWEDAPFDTLDWSLDIEYIRVKPKSTCNDTLNCYEHCKDRNECLILESTSQYKSFDRCNFDLYGKKIVSKDGKKIDAIYAIINDDYKAPYFGALGTYSNKTLFDHYLIDGEVIGDKQ